MSTVTFRPAKRERIPLLLGLAGGTGSGKTFSGMRLAKGLAGGERFAVIDTENGRALHYADDFAFDHAALEAPFRPERYAEAIRAAEDKGYGVILVDSMSHEWEGDGGMLDWQEDEFKRLGGRDAVKMTSWIEPKRAHRKFVTHLLQVRAHIILCFRAGEKIEMIRENGKMQVVPKRTLTGLDGWVPISEKSLPYELTMSCLLTANAPGVPKPIKLQEQHRAFVPLDKPLTERTGEQLAKWAVGSTAAKPRRQVEAEAAELTARLLELAERLDRRDTVAEAVERHLASHERDISGHVTWLKNQIKRADEAAEKLAGVGT